MTKLTIKTNNANGNGGNILSPDALAFVETLMDKFSARHAALMSARAAAQERINDGELPDFPPDTAEIRNGDWQVADAPAILQDRRVEITAPADMKMAITALNSPAKVYMADFEDSLSPTWQNVLAAQEAMYAVCRAEAELTDAARGKTYRLNPNHDCVLFVRPRGWHLREKNVHYDGAPMIAALFDFGLFFFHNAKILASRGRGPFLYLPKTEHWQEAKLWDDIIAFAEREIGLDAGTTKATLLIETLPAVFQMDEILHAMQSRLVGLNCGRWDYIFSYIKTLQAHPDRVMPERHAVTMAQPLMNAYSRALIQTCHRRNAHAMGGMSAFIPVRGDAAENEAALAKVREDKRREAANGHDGTWVAHPDLIPVAAEVFDAAMPAANQKTTMPDGIIGAPDLLAVPDGGVSAGGFDNNIEVAIRYLSAWFAGNGAVPIFNLMEDAATAEIARSQLWQWVRYPTRLVGGGDVDADYFNQRLGAILENLKQSDNPALSSHADAAADILRDMAFEPKLADFLTLRAYPAL